MIKSNTVDVSQPKLAEDGPLALVMWIINEFDNTQILSNNR